MDSRYQYGGGGSAQGANAFLQGLSKSLAERLPGYRVEIICLGALGAGFGAAYRLTHRNPVTAGVLVAALTCVVLVYGPLRRRLSLSLEVSRVARRWDRAVRHAKIGHPIPLARVRRVEVGHSALVQLTGGTTIRDLNMRRETLASSMKVRELLLQGEERADRGRVTIVRRNPRATVNPWHGIEAEYSLPRAGGPAAESPRFTDPIALGTDAHGKDISLSMLERGILIGGQPRTGKSSTLHLITARAALDPSVRLYLIDRKRVELACWKDCAERFGRTIQEGISILEELMRVVDERYQKLEERGVRRVTQEDDEFPFFYLAVEELMPFTDHSDSALKKRFNGLLQDVVALGPAAGVIPALVTQKPQGTVIPTQIRDLVPYRLAFNCATKPASDTILGSDYAAAGYDASSLGIGHPGLGLLLEESNVPVKVQVHYLDDERIRALATLARARRQRYSTRGDDRWSVKR